MNKRLDTKQIIELSDWAKQMGAEAFQNRTLVSLAKEAEKTLGFGVSPASLSDIALHLGIRSLRERNGTAPEGSRSHRRNIRAVAQCLKALYQELGLEVPEELNTLTKV